MTIGSMRIRRAWRAALAVGALAASGALAPAVAQDATAQQSSECAATNGDGTRIAGALNTPAPDHVESSKEQITVDASGFEYRDSSQLFNEADMARIQAHILLCGPEDPAFPRQLPDGAVATKATGSEPMALNWITPGLPYNGPYAVVITATATNDTTRRIVRPFTMNLPARAPRNVTVASAASSTSVTVSWDSNPEPDIFGYAVEWTAGSDKTFANAKSAAVEPDDGDRQTFTHDPGAGSWLYRVTAARRGGGAEAINVSSPSSTAPVTVSGPPATTAPDSGTTSGGGSTATSTSGTPSGTSSGTSSATFGSAATKPGGATGSDLSRLSTLLDQRRAAAAPKRLPEPDPGFNETLPFSPGDQPAVVASPEAGGIGGAELGSTQQIITDDSDRRRAMSFVAGGLLTLVIALGMRMVKSEADRGAELEPTAPVADEAPADNEATPVAGATVAATAVPQAPPGPTEHDVTTTNPEVADVGDLGDPETPARVETMPVPRRRTRSASSASTALDVPLPARRERRERRERRAPAA